MIKRISLLIAAALLTVVLVVGAATPLFAAPQQCTSTTPGCKTVDNPDKNNPKFVTFKKGEGGGSGSFNSACNENPSGKKCR